MTENNITFNLDGLEKLTKGLGGTYRARVGVLGSDAARTDGGELNNAELGAIQIWGSETAGIPPRDFLLMPIQRNQRAIIKSLEGNTMKAAVETGDIKKVFTLLGMAARQYVDQAFVTGGFGQWAPNAPSTIRQKKSSAPLIDTSQLRRAVSNDVVKAATGGAA